MSETISKLMEEMRKTLGTAEVDAEKFAKGNGAAGTRLRISMQELKSTAQDVRVAVSKAKNTGKGV